MPHYDPAIPPPLRTPLLDAQGIIVRAWAMFFEQREMHGVHFDLDNPLAVGIVETTRPAAIFGGKLRFVKANAAAAPVGASMIIDFQKSEDGGASWESVFREGNANLVNIPSGSNAVVTVTAFASEEIRRIIRDTIFRPEIIQVGSTTPGGFVQLVAGWT